METFGSVKLQLIDDHIKLLTRLESMRPKIEIDGGKNALGVGHGRKTSSWRGGELFKNTLNLHIYAPSCELTCL